MLRNLFHGLLIAACLLCASSTCAAEPRNQGPWDLTKLKTVPTSTFGETSGRVQQVYYEGEDYQGRPTRVFGYYARPVGVTGRAPAMVLVHGGGGKAFAEWATLWAERGYAALAMDLAGVGPDGQRLPDGGPPQDDAAKFQDFVPLAASNDDKPAITERDMWSYHAVANVIRGHSWLAAQPEVDADRIGITGISWGGYLTCIVTGLDDRLKVSVPVYGCGFLQDNSAWLQRFAAMSDEQQARWHQHFDPSQYLAAAACPMLFVNGTNDFAYPMDSYQKSYRLVPENHRQLCIRVRMPHGHVEGWVPVEIGLFVDSHLKGAAPLPKLEDAGLNGDQWSAKVIAKTKIDQAELHFTTDSGPWQERVWQSMPATLEGDQLRATLPAARPLVAYLSVTDDRGALVSTEHVELPAK